MVIDQQLLDDLTAQAKESARLRMNLDLRISAGGAASALESGTVILEMKDGAYEPVSPEDIMTL